MALLLSIPWAARAEDPIRYRFEAGQKFSFQVVQETRPAQGPAFSRAELTYRFEVLESAGDKSRLRAEISGQGVRGPDPTSVYPEAQKGRTLDYEGIDVEFGLTSQGPAEGSAAKPAKSEPVGSPAWAIAANVAQFFPFLAASETKVRSKVFGPDLFRDFPEDRPELTGLLWTEEAVETTFAAPSRVEIGGAGFDRIDFTGGFRKTTTHRGVNFSGTYTIVGFALIDPVVGRPVAFKIDDAKSQYRIAVIGGSFIPRKVAEKRLAAANDGRTPIRLEACDPTYLERLKEYAGFERLRGPVPLGGTPRAAAELPLGQVPPTSLLGM